jgi:uncharacterized membrane protein YbhN (UPF0104 family)
MEQQDKEIVINAPSAGGAEPAQNGRPKKKRWNILSALFMIALIVATLVILSKDTSINEVWSAVRSADLSWLLVALGAALFASVLFGVALHIALRALYKKPIPILRDIGFGFIGQYYTAITPAGAAGQPMQLYYMLAFGVDVSYASLALLLVNAAHQIVVLLVPTVLFPFHAGLILDNLGAFLWFFLFGAIVNIGLILFLVFAMFSKSFAERAVRWVIGLLAKLHIVKHADKVNARAEEQILRYSQGAEVFKKHPWLIFGELITYVLLLCSQFVIPYFIYRAFGLSGFGVMDFIALQSVLYLAVCFLPIPGSAGVSESGFVTIFRVLFQSALIVPAMLLSRMASFYIILVISGVISLAMHVLLTYRKKRAKRLSGATGA